MSYLETSIIEANYNDRTNEESNSNNFSVKVPPRIINKGSSLSISGAIVKEISANNDSIIELSNLNISNTNQYTSSWASLELRYYMNNNGLNSVVFPFIQTNYSLRQQFKYNGHDETWPEREIFPTSSSHVHRMEEFGIPINIISGPGIITSQRQDYSFQGSGTYIPDTKVKFMRFFEDIENIDGSFGYWSSKQGDMDADRPYDPYNYLGNGNIYNYRCLEGVVGIRTALKKNRPDGSKFTYIKPGYKGPGYVDSSEQTGVKDIEIYTRNIELNLSKDLMESADEITLKINQRLRGLNVNKKDNLVEVRAKFRQWSTDYIREQENQSQENGLYPPNSDKTIFDISSDTLINISANWQNNQYHEIFGESFFVKDAERWVYGQSLFKMNNRMTFDNVTNNYLHVRGIDPTEYQAAIPDFTSIYRNTSSGSTERCEEYPSMIGVSIRTAEGILTPFAYDETGVTSVEWMFFDEIPDVLVHGTTNLMRFRFLNDNGSPVNSHLNGPIYAAQWISSPGHNQYFMCQEEDEQGRYFLVFRPAENNGGVFTKTSNERIFHIEINHSIIGLDTIPFYDYIQNSNFKLLCFAGGDPLDPRAMAYASRTHNGLPYYIVDNNLGGPYCNYNQDEDPIVDEYSCLSDRFVIPTNVKITEGDHDFSNVLDRVRNFFRANETYCGEETDPILMDKDSLNWYCDLDVGMASDFNNAYSNWLSSRGEPGHDTVDYTIYGNEQNYSIYPRFYPNMMSYHQYDLGVPGTNGYNFRRPLHIYPISRYARMGCHYQNTENYIRVYSRFSNYILQHITATNEHMNCDFFSGSPAMRLHPMISFDRNNKIINGYCEKNNISVVGVNYADSEAICLGFIHFRSSAGRNLTHGMDYSLPPKQDNFRTCFRICSGCNIGFDPASTTNPYMSAVNRDQSVATNGDYFCCEFFASRSTTDLQTNLEVGNYSYGAKETPIYSPRVEDYINNVWIGAINPQIQYNNGRMSFSNLYTPRRFNSNDALPGDPNIGNIICAINDPTMFFSNLNCTIGTVPSDKGPNGTHAPAPSNNNISARGQPGFFQVIKNIGLCDSLSGIGIENIYVRNEVSKGTQPGDNGVYVCTIDINDKTTNYKGSLFDLLGFDLRQLKPYFGRSYNRCSTTTYNKTDANKYNGLNFFTLNSYFDQTNCQLLNIFGPNFNSVDPTSDPTPNTIYYPASIRSQSEFLNSYVGFQPINIQVSSDQLRAERLTAKLQQAFYKICCDLPSGSYITNNNALNCISYFYRQYKNSNFYFVYSTGREITLTEDFLLTSINTRILNENNREAEHLGDNVTVFYKITEKKQLNQFNQNDLKSYQTAITQPTQLSQASGKPYIPKMTPYQNLQKRAIAIKNNTAGANPDGNYDELIINENGQVLGSEINDNSIVLPDEINTDDIQMVSDFPEQKEESLPPMLNEQEVEVINNLYRQEVEEAQREGRKAKSRTEITQELMERNVIQPFGEYIPFSTATEEDPVLTLAEMRREVPRVAEVIEQETIGVVKPDEDPEEAAAVPIAEQQDLQEDPGAIIDVPIAQSSTSLERLEERAPVMEPETVLAAAVPAQITPVLTEQDLRPEVEPLNIVGGGTTEQRQPISEQELNDLWDIEIEEEFASA